MTRRIGFACKFMHSDRTQSEKVLEGIQREYCEKSTTVAWLNRQKVDVAEQKLWDIMCHNTNALYNLITYVGSLPNELRMVRIGSNQLPVYTEPNWNYYWRKADVRAWAERAYSRVGDHARSLDVRLSFHPGQFTVLASDNADIVDRSIAEFEYHCDIIRWMGYGQTWQDFKCNVHISGKRGPEGILAALPRLSPEARNTLTIENDENSWGIDASLELAKDVALVLDIHHHWCHSGGEYIQPTDDRVKKIFDSWRGVRPVIHYSVSREDYLVGHSDSIMPDFQSLLSTGHKKQKLRAHSEYYWNSAVNDWALSFWNQADIMCESKMKNLASIGLHNHAKIQNI